MSGEQYVKIQSKILGQAACRLFFSSMLVHVSKCVGTHSMIKIKEHIAESGFCRVLQQDRNVGIPPSPPSLYLEAQTSTQKNTVFHWKVMTFSRRPSVIYRLSVLLRKHYREEKNEDYQKSILYILIVHSFYFTRAQM